MSRTARLAARCLLLAATALGASALTLPLETGWLAAERAAAGTVEPDPRWYDLERLLRAPGNRSARAFYGIGDEAGDPAASCDAVLRAARRVPGRNASAPTPGAEVGLSVALLRHLEDAHPPSTAGSPFWEATAALLPEIQRRLLARATPAAPADLLKICTDVAGEARLGVLACHNLLKEVTFEARRSPPDRVPDRCGRVAAALRPWRSRPHTPKGGLDKLGPLYHVFAALTGGVWTGSARLASALADAEAARRIFHAGNDHPDPEKALADRCGAAAAALILSR